MSTHIYGEGRTRDSDIDNDEDWAWYWFCDQCGVESRRSSKERVKAWSLRHWCLDPSQQGRDAAEVRAVMERNRRSGGIDTYEGDLR